MSVVEGAYCNATTDLQQRGVYLKKNIVTIPGQTHWDLEQIVVNAADKINSLLFIAGITVPVLEKHINARRRLRYLNALLTNADMESALMTVANPSGAYQKMTGKLYKDQFDSEIEVFLKEPESLFAGDSATVDSDTYDPRKIVRPSGNMMYSYTEDQSIEPTMTIDMEF